MGDAYKVRIALSIFSIVLSFTILLIARLLISGFTKRIIIAMGVVLLIAGIIAFILNLIKYKNQN